MVFFLLPYVVLFQPISTVLAFSIFTTVLINVMNNVKMLPFLNNDKNLETLLGFKLEIQSLINVGLKIYKLFKAYYKSIINSILIIHIPKLILIMCVEPYVISIKNNYFLSAQSCIIFGLFSELNSVSKHNILLKRKEEGFWEGYGSFS
jgi:hypothetical protein